MAVASALPLQLVCFDSELSTHSAACFAVNFATMSWAAANIHAGEQQALTALSRRNDDADATNKRCYEAAVRAHHSGGEDDLKYALETYQALLAHPRLNATKTPTAGSSGSGGGSIAARWVQPVFNLRPKHEQAVKTRCSL